MKAIVTPNYIDNDTRLVRSRKLYLAGPMRGIPMFNFPAFIHVAKVLRGRGFEVWSPAEADQVLDGFNPVAVKHDGLVAPKSFAHYMRRDLPAVCDADAVALLPGWEKSTGAKLELHVARHLPIPIVDAETLEVFTDAELDAKLCGVPITQAPIDEDEYHAREAALRRLEYAPLGIGGAPLRAGTLPTEGSERKKYPVASGCTDYFPDALAAVSHVSFVGNEQHNPGQPLHWDRTKSKDEADTMIRHFLQRGSKDTDGIRHSAKMAWRALAILQKELEGEA